MANKVALAAALLVALVAVASAATITTTVTTTSYDKEGSQKYHQCSQQVQGRQFRACQRYFKQGSGEDVEEEVLEMTAANPQQQYLQECCQQLKEMDRQQCGCEAIKQAVRQAQQGGSSYQTGQSEQIYQKARALPSRCQLREQHCRFSVIFV